MILYTNKHKIQFQIDGDDFEAVSYFSWYKAGGYIKTSIKTPKGQRQLALQGFLLGPAPDGLEWDHKNQDPLDNRRENLRAVTDVVNQRNARVRVDNNAGLSGIYRAHGRWFVRISHNKERIKIGRFDTLEEAITARKKAENFYWGDQR